MLGNVLHTNYRDTIIIGDFNFGCIKWDTKSTTMRSVSADVFLDIIGNLFLEQLVNEPTGIRNEQTRSLLDLVMTSIIHFVDEIYLQNPIGKGDHVDLNIFLLLRLRMRFLLKEDCIKHGNSISNKFIRIIYCLIKIHRIHGLYSMIILFCIKCMCTSYQQAYSYEHE